MLSNPYPDPPPGSSDHKITARVSLEDFYFHKKLIPAQFGLTDKVISTLFKAFTDELRRLHTLGAFNNPAGQFDAGWYIDSPTYLLYERVLSEFQRQPAAELTRQASPRDDSVGASGIREEVRGSTEQRPESKGSTPPGSGKPRRSKETKSKETK